MFKKLSLLIMFFCFFSVLDAVEAKQLKKIVLSQENDIIIQKASALIVPTDNRILVADSKAANIKIFDMTGKRLGIFGRKGMGPNEFVRPLRLAYLEPFVAIMDYGRDMTFIYKYSGPSGFQFIRKFLTLQGGYDICLLDDANLLITGSKYDKKKRIHNLYRYNFIKNKYHYILPEDVSFGYTSAKKFEIDNDNTFSLIGSRQCIDFSDDRFFMVWKGDLQVIRVDRKTLNIKRFGKSSKHFVKPYVTPEIRQAYQRRDHRLLWKLDRPMSSVRKIFLTRTNKLGVIYLGPFKEDGSLPVRLQMYTADGQFLDDIDVMTASAQSHNEIYCYFRKSDNHLYILDTDTSEKFDQFYNLYEFMIKE